MAEEGIGGVEGVTIDENPDGSMTIEIDGRGEGPPIHITVPD